MHIFENLLINFIYAAFGGAMTIGLMYVASKLLDKMTDFDTSQLIKEGNIGAAIVYAGMLIGIGIAIGNVIGMGLN